MTNSEVDSMLEEQHELDINVALDDVGRAARAYLNVKEEERKIKEDLLVVELELISALRVSGRDRINIKGKFLVINHIDQEKIKIIK